MKKFSKNSFTIVELLIVIAIIAILAAVVLISLDSARQNAWEGRGMQFSQNIKSAHAVDLVGEWSFDTVDFIDATHIKDASGNDNTGTLINSPIPTDEGKVREALEFNGNNTYVDLGNQSSLRNFTNEITVETWVYYYAYGSTTGQSYSVIIVKGSPWTFLLENPSQRLRFRLNVGGLDRNAQDQSTHELDKWYHVVGTYDGQNIKIYRNGTQVGIQPITGVLGVNNITAKIGTYTGNTYNFNGIIDEIRVYKRALTSKEVKKLYAENLLEHLAVK